jgi:hypothetical protein
MGLSRRWPLGLPRWSDPERMAELAGELVRSRPQLSFSKHLVRCAGVGREV